MIVKADEISGNTPPGELELNVNGGAEGDTQGHEDDGAEGEVVVLIEGESPPQEEEEEEEEEVAEAPKWV